MMQRQVKQNSFYARFRNICDKVLPDELFDDLYTGIGRPPVSPSMLMRLQLLMIKYKCGDEMALENLLYDERWRYMCNVPLHECNFHPTTLHYFRLRLTFGTINRAMIAQLKEEGIILHNTPLHRIFEATKLAAVKMGILSPEDAQYIDSTNILGAATVQDTFMLLFQGLRQLAQAQHKAVDPETEQAILARLKRTEYLSDKRKPQIDWQDEAARMALLVELIQDASVLMIACENVEDAAVCEAMAQMKRLIGQDIEVTEEGKTKIRQGVAKDRQCSVVDPDMRHGRKSSSKRFNGYKATVAVEPKSGILTGIDTMPGSNHDSLATAAILEQTSPAVMGGDQAYAGGNQRAAALAQGTVILTPTGVAKPFDKDSFELDEEENTVTCAVGNVAKIGKNGTVKFPARNCKSCPNRELCNPSGKGRTLTIGEHETLQRNLRAAARSGNWADFLRMRCVVEHTIAKFLRWAGRKGRYFGTTKTGIQMIFGAIGYNLDRLGHHHAKKASQTVTTA